MTSEKQLLANRENGKLGGVKTEEGKLRVRFNALKHGLSSRHLLALENVFVEELASYLEILEGFTQSLGPKSFLEEVLVDKMARAYFKMLRCDAMEASAFSSDYDLETKQTFLTVDPLMQNKVDFYRTRLESQFYRAKEELHKSRAAQQLDLFSPIGASDE